jgi:hypothetical protein
MRTHGGTSLESLRWALAFHGRHILVVSALMAVPAAQRFVIMSWDLPDLAATASEVIVTAARIALLIYVVGKVGPAPRAWASTRAFLRDRWPSLLITVGLLLLAFAVFDLALERVVPLAVPGSAQDAYRSILFAVKNLTVIPFTMIWMVSVVRTCVQYDPAQAAAASR